MDKTPMLTDGEINTIFGQDMSAIGDWIIDCRKVAQAQLAKAEPYYRADERERIIREIEEDFVAPAANFYMDEENLHRAFELWKGVKKQALKSS